MVLPFPREGAVFLLRDILKMFNNFKLKGKRNYPHQTEIISNLIKDFPLKE